MTKTSPKEQRTAGIARAKEAASEARMAYRAVRNHNSRGRPVWKPIVAAKEKWQAAENHVRLLIEEDVLYSKRELQENE